jgi:S-adenosylmethionine:tRNA ribosyltransferase-isomerase
MASAARPFTHRVITELLGAGVRLAPIVLQAGVSSPELHEPPFPEPFFVPRHTARQSCSAAATRRRFNAVTCGTSSVTVT